MFKRKKSGFTLVEILVSVAIIAILMTLSVISTSRVRMKSRDAKRISNAKEIVAALEAYYNANKAYPAMIYPGQPIAANGNQYLSSVPSNPFPRTDGGCANQDYTYEVTPSGYKFTICIGSDNARFEKGIVICKNGNCGIKDYDVACGPGVTVTDRDGYVYSTIEIGTQCWMKENLKTKTKSDGNPLKTGVGWYCASGSPCAYPGSTYWFSDRFCMNGGLNSECDMGQGVYTWYAAMDVSFSDPTPPEGSQGLCPNGWHIPTHDEFTTLERNVCTSSTCATDFPYNNTTIGSRGTNEGSTLHNINEFNFGYMGGIDVYSGGNCPVNWPSTYCTGGIRYHFGSGGDIWTSTTFGPSGSVGYPSAWFRNINTVDMPKIKRLNDFSKFLKISVRCIKDPS